MNRGTPIVFAALSALLAITGCEDEPEEAVLVSDPVLDRERQEPEAPLRPEDLQPVAGTTESGAASDRVPPAVAVLAVDVECNETAVFFETDAAELGPEDERKLDRLAACLQGTAEQEHLEITGRADPRASEPYNQRLSEERARAVAEHLSQAGVAEESFEIRAMGEQGLVEGRPVLWPAQRRVMVEPTEGGSGEQAR